MQHFRRDALVLGATKQVDKRAEEARWIAQRPVALEAQLEEVFAQHDDRFGAVDQTHVAGEAELEGVVAQEAIAEGMEGVDRRVRLAVRNEHVDTRLHLARRVVSEGERQDLPRQSVLCGDEPGHPTGDHLRLAGARSGDDEQRPAAMRDRLALLTVEPTHQRAQRFERDRRDGRSGPDRALYSRQKWGDRHAWIVAATRAT